MSLSRLRLLVVGLFLFVLSASPASADTVLVEGQPPLTQEMVNDVNDFFEWLLETPMTTVQRQEMQQSLVESWQREVREDIEAVQDIRNLRAELAGVSEGEREFLQVQLQEEILELLRQQPEEPMARMLVGLYEAAHTPIAVGSPPLTRQMADAHAEVLFFMFNEVAGGEVFELSQQFRDEWAQLLAVVYGGYSAAEQEAMGQLPLQAAALRVAWPSLPEEQRGALREQWRGQLAELRPASAAGQEQVQPAADSGNPVLREALAGAEAEREALEPFRQRADRMSCDELMGLSGGEEYDLTVSQSLTRLKCLNDKERLEDANYPPAEQAARRLARSQANFSLASNVSNLQHQANTAIISNIGNNGWRYEYRPVP